MAEAIKRFATQAFMRGIGSLIDIGGRGVGVRLEPRDRTIHVTSVGDAIRGDWLAVGGYMRKAMNRCERERNR